MKVHQAFGWRRLWIALLLPSVLALAALGCSRVPSQQPQANAASRPAELDPPRQDGTDITFLVAADTHLGIPGMEELNRKQVEAMNAMPGTEYPAEIGGKVATPQGVLIAGDLTDTGRIEQWDAFKKLYGLTGKDGLLKFPLYEGTGNHDRYVEGAYGDRMPVLEDVTKRHGGLTYWWKWHDVHFFNLDEWPDPQRRAWLEEQLKSVNRETPIVIYFHYGLSGPYSDWWKDQDKEAFAQIIKGYNVIALFHGHYHGSGHYVWKGYDVYNVGSVRHRQNSFAVVHITDDRLTVGSWNFNLRALRQTGPEQGWEWHHAKKIKG